MEAWPTFFFLPTDSALMICQAKVILLNQTERKGNKEHEATETVSASPASCLTNSTSRSLVGTNVVMGVDTPADVQHVRKQQQL